MAIALTMGGSYSIGFLSMGLGAGYSDGTVRSVCRHLITGGAILLVPVVGHIGRLVIGVGTPPWVALLALVVTAAVTVVIGLRLESEGFPAR